MNTKTIFIILLAFVIWDGTASAQTPLVTQLDVNNISADISSGSDLFWDFTNSGFEVPKGGGTHSAYVGNLWIGGIDNGGNLRMAAQTYRQNGTDYIPGPLDTVTGLPATPASAWNKSWKLTRVQVQNHIANYSNVGYVVPAAIADWPGYNAGLNRNLAPFFDFNSNGIYDPANGDYPVMMGDMMVYSIFNDVKQHTESGCAPLSVEVHRMFWAYSLPSNPALNNTIFCRYVIKNHSQNTYSNVITSLWTDFDIGDYIDDYVGSHLGLDMVYGYNGDAIDGSPPIGYGSNPPALGVYFLNAGLLASDVFGLTSTPPGSYPTTCNAFRNYAMGLWDNGSPITYGAYGLSPSNPATTYMFPGNTNPNLFPTYGAWSEYLSGNVPGDRNMLGSIGHGTMLPGGVISFDAAYTWSRASSGGQMASVNQLFADAGQIIILYNNGTVTGTITDIAENPLEKDQFLAYPNPAKDEIHLLSVMPESQILISDISGRLVMTATGSSRISVEHLPRGMYVLSVEHQGTWRRTKLILD
jgi:hypothetical protein